MTEIDISLPSFQSYKKESSFPLIEISNRQLNLTSNQKNKREKRIFFEEENTTISGWSVHGAE